MTETTIDSAAAALAWIRANIDPAAHRTGTGGGCTAVEIPCGAFVVLITDELCAPEAWTPVYDPCETFGVRIHVDNDSSAQTDYCDDCRTLADVAAWLKPRIAALRRVQS